jgi:hypothetical protein
MRASPPPARSGRGRRSLARRLVAAAAVATALAAGAACDANADPQQVVGRSRLVNDLAGRLTRTDGLTYTVVYQLPGGATATVARAQHPGRQAYAYPGGLLSLTPTWTADCRTQATTTCTLTPPPSPSVDPNAGLLAAMAGRGLIAPPTVISLLTAAALDRNAIIFQHDTTIVGRNATCVEVSGVDNAPASQFNTCVTIDGLLGSFKGTVNSAPIDMTLNQYDAHVSPTAFDLPPGARVTDQRPR